MSKDELIAEILKLPEDDQRSVIAAVWDHLPDPDMTAELRAELERRYQDMVEHPEDEVTWEQASAELDRRAEARRKSASK